VKRTPAKRRSTNPLGRLEKEVRARQRPFHHLSFRRRATCRRKRVLDRRADGWRADQIDRADRAAFPQAWIGIFSHDLSVLQVGAEYLHRVGPFFGFFGIGYALYCVGQATRRMEASVFAALLRAAIAVLGGLAVVWLKADVTWNFIAVALGMVAFGLFALPPLINRSGYE
jgi:hypothetical protein